MVNAFLSLRWHRLRTEFRAAHEGPIPFFPFQAILKHVFKAAVPGSSWSPQGTPPVFFHIREKRWHHTLHVGERITVEFLFCGGRHHDDAHRFAEVLPHHMKQPDNRRHVSLLSVSEPEERSFEHLTKEQENLPDEGEICLEFLTPLPFKPLVGYDRTVIGKEAFLLAFTKRLARLFGKDVVGPIAQDGWEINPCCWRFTETSPHLRKGVVGQMIIGCFGPLYLTGNLKDLHPLLLLGSELHAGRELGDGQGYYLLKRNEPFFDRRFPSLPDIEKTMRETMEKHDGVPEYLVESIPGFLDEKVATADIVTEIKSGTYRFSPAIAFRIPKRNGGTRIAERLSLRDAVVTRSLLRLLDEPLGRLFSEKSLGYRKGIPRRRAAEMIDAAIAEGFIFVLESDIEDFFPSIDHERLEALLDRYIPRADTTVRSLLSALIRIPFILDGKEHAREKGLPQGSPLSPLLANLYLDRFDHEITGDGVRLIRYADDFVVLTKTREDAEKWLSCSAALLSKMGLSLKREKTNIRPVTEGFSFLGYRFGMGETEIPEETPEAGYRKPLYICHPFSFLSQNGEALDIIREGKVIESFPFRRISEIIVTEKASFSTTVVRSCKEMGIPLAISTGSAYSAVSFYPDDKCHLDALATHRNLYHTLSENDKIAIAGEIAVAKITGYRTLYSGRHEKGLARLLKKLDAICSRIERSRSIDEIRGHEGNAASLCYEKLRALILVEPFKLTTRDREAKDPMNALLNYGYALLFARIHLTLRAMGIDPYLGFLHSSENRYESFVCDLQEPFRARIDRALIRMVNLKIIGEKDFKETPKGLYLTTDARSRFLENFEREMQSRTKKGGRTLLEEIYLQAVIVKQWIQGKRSLIFYRWEER